MRKDEGRRDKGRRWRRPLVFHDRRISEHQRRLGADVVETFGHIFLTLLAQRSRHLAHRLDQLLIQLRALL